MRPITNRVHILVTLIACVIAVVPSTQQNALVLFYGATNGTHWETNTNWLNGDPCSNRWFGVTCDDSDTNILALDLGYNNLRGYLPQEMEMLIFLEELDLEWNNITGPLTIIASFPNLTYVDLSYNEMTGTLPEVLQCQNSNNSVTMVLYWNNLTGTLPESWNTFLNLQSLQISSNQISGTLPESWSALVNLVELNVFSNDISGTLPHSWSGLTNLEELNVFDNSLTGTLPEAWNALVKLKQLNVGNNNLYGPCPNSWNTLTALEYL